MVKPRAGATQQTDSNNPIEAHSGNAISTHGNAGSASLDASALPPLEKGAIEKRFWSKGFTLVGVDEVGRGCLAGPVYAAAVILDPERLLQVTPKDQHLIRDSKTLSASQRLKAEQVIFPLIEDHAIGVATVEEIESVGILKATFLAMKRAIERLEHPFHLLLVDGNQKISGYSGAQETIIDGDAYCYSIAAASIIAKNARDLFMAEQSRIYPNYGFEKHVGYGTKHHIDQLKTHGICPLHRKTFAPVKDMVSLK